jgi:hypothetical protein
MIASFRGFNQFSERNNQKKRGPAIPEMIIDNIEFQQGS